MLIKRFVGLTLAIVLVLGFIPFAMFPVQGAAGFGPEGKLLAPIYPPAADSKPISSRVGLEAIINDMSGKYHLTSDIDLSGAEWAPLGYTGSSLSSYFSGVLDGQGHKITNLRISGYRYSQNGLFAIVSGGTVKNLGFENTSISILAADIGSHQSHSAGSVAGAISNANIINCYNTGAVQSSLSRWSASIGGLFGEGLGESRVVDCYNTGSISATSFVTVAGIASTAGGICGRDTYSVVDFIDCYNSGNISARGDGSGAFAAAGGISGESVASVVRCYNTGNISAVAANARFGDAWAGGLVGQAGRYGGSVHISQSFNTGKVTASAMISRVGGICGEASSALIENCYSSADLTANVYSNSGYSSGAGGICGYGGRATEVKNCYSAGNIDSDFLAAGIVGYSGADSFHVSDSAVLNTGGLVAIVGGTGGSNNLARNDIPGSPNNDASRLLPNEEFYIQSTWEDIGFDFETTWMIPAGGGYPIFRWQAEEIVDDGALRIRRVSAPNWARLSNLPQPGGIDGTITALVNNSVTSQLIDIEPTIEDASWTLHHYNDKLEYVELANKQLPLRVGENNAFIELTAPGFGKLVYLVTIIRLPPADPNTIRRVSIVFHAGLADEGKKNISMEIDWGWNLFNKSSFGYDNSIAIPALALSGAVEISESQAEMVLDKLNFERIEHYDYSNTPYAAHTIASAKLKYGNSEYTLIAAIARGTTGFMDFVVDVNPLGFASSAQVVKENIEKYAVKYGIDLVSDNIKFLLTGHSLGGAVANLLSIKLSDYAAASNTFVYTFASPLTVYAKLDRGGVFNVVNRDDGVPYLSSALARHRIGEDIAWWRNGMIDQRFYYLTGGRSLAEIMERRSIFYWEIPGQEITKFLTAHDTTTYMSYLLSRGDAGELYRYKIRIAAFKCPVDVFVYNKSGDLVGRVIDNIPEFVDVFIWLNGDEKYVYMPFDDTYTFKISGTGNGTLDYLVYEIDSATGEVVAQKEFSNVALFRGKQMSSEMIGDNSFSQTRLYVLDSLGKPTAEVSEDGTEQPLQTGGNDGNSGNSNGNNPGGNWGLSQPQPQPALPLPTPAPVPASAFPGVGISNNPFTDIKETDWFYSNVMFAYTRGLMGGTSSNPMLFSPNVTTTRGMIVTILYRLEGTPAFGGSPNSFGDVAPGMWFSDAVNWAAGNDIVAGTGGGKFAPNTAITRQDLAVILSRYMSYKKIALPTSDQWITFADGAAVSGYAMDAIQDLNKLGIIGGTGKNAAGQTIISPKDNATRAQAAAMLQRFIELTKK